MKKAVRSIFVICLLFVGGSVVYAQNYGLEATAGAAGLQRGDVPTLAGSIIGTALSMIGVLFFVLMVYGGFLWMIARGNEEQVRKAKDTIIEATIGLIVVLSSYAITNFVFSSLQASGSCVQRGSGPDISGCASYTTRTSCQAPNDDGSASPCEWR